MSTPVDFVLTIDTETDTWEPSREPATRDNLREIPRVHRMLTDLGVRPSWLLTWEVACDPWASGLFAEIHASGEAEIGAHLHPWECPPMDEALTPANTMMCNLSESLQREKLRRLTERVAEIRGGDPPTGFRAGRWGLDEGSVRVLAECGYRVDTSVTPWISWESEEGPSFVGAPEHAYTLGTAGPPTTADPEGPLVEIPMTAGYTRRPYAAAHRASTLMRGPLLSRLHAAGIAHRLGALRRVFLSPETDGLNDLLRLAKNHLALGVGHLNMMFHSQSLLPGLSPFVRDTSEAARFEERIRGFVGALDTMTAVRFATLSEAGEAVRN